MMVGGMVFGVVVHNIFLMGVPKYHEVIMQ